MFRFVAAPESWHQELLAAAMWAGRGSWVSHRSAGALWGLEGIPTGSLELTVSRHVRPPGSAIKLHYVERMPESDVTTRPPFPLTDVSRTLCDLAAVIAPLTLETALEHALRSGMTSLGRLWWRVEALRASRRPGIEKLRRLLDDRGPGRPAESGLEIRLLRLLKEAGLPLPQRQYEAWADGRLVARLDFAYPVARVALEVDGYRWHSGRAAWESDLPRNNRLTQLGWRVVHLSWHDITKRRDDVVHTVCELLELPWPGRVRA